MTEIGPIGSRYQAHEITLNLFWFGLPGKIETAGQSGDVGINDNTFVDLESIPEHHVRRFSADTG
jgi:hypothetical protein